MTHRQSIIREAIRLMLEDAPPAQGGPPAPPPETQTDALLTAQYLAKVRTMASAQKPNLEAFADDFDNVFPSDSNYIGLVRAFARIDAEFIALADSVGPLGLLYLGAVVEKADLNNVNYMFRRLLDACRFLGGTEAQSVQESRAGRFRTMLRESRTSMIDDIVKGLDKSAKKYFNVFDSKLLASILKNESDLASAVLSGGKISDNLKGHFRTKHGIGNQLTNEIPAGVSDETALLLKGQISSQGYEKFTLDSLKSFNRSIDVKIREADAVVSRLQPELDRLSGRRLTPAEVTRRAELLDPGSPLQVAKANKTRLTADKAALEDISDEIDQAFTRAASDQSFIRKIMSSYAGTLIRSSTAAKVALGSVLAAPSILSFTDIWLSPNLDPEVVRSLNSSDFTGAVAAVTDADGADGLSRIADAFVRYYNLTVEGDALQSLSESTTGDVSGNLTRILTGKAPVPEVE